MSCKQMLDAARDVKAFDGRKLKQNNYTAWLAGAEGLARRPDAVRSPPSDDDGLWNG